MTLSGMNVSDAKRSDMKRSDLPRRWIAANTIPAAFTAVASLAVFLIGKAMGVPGSGASLPARAMYVALETVVIAAGLMLYAQMTAQALATNIPAFPYRAWTAMHLTLGVALGFLMGLAMLEAGDAEPVQWSDWTELAILLLLMIVLRCVIAAFFGGLQALVLRRVAMGLGRWVAFWVLAVGPLVAFAALIELLFEDPRSLTHELVFGALTVAIGLIGALVMLPAVYRLQPKT